MLQRSTTPRDALSVPLEMTQLRFPRTVPADSDVPPATWDEAPSPRELAQRRKERLQCWQQSYQKRLTQKQAKALQRLDIALECLLPLESLSYNAMAHMFAQNGERWNAAMTEYRKAMLAAVRHGLLALAHPVVVEWVETRRILGDRQSLHALWHTHPHLERDVKPPIPETEIELVAEVERLHHQGKSWRTIHKYLYRNGSNVPKQWQSFHEWLEKRTVCRPDPEMLDEERKKRALLCIGKNTHDVSDGLNVYTFRLPCVMHRNEDGIPQFFPEILAAQVRAYIQARYTGQLPTFLKMVEAMGQHKRDEY